MRFILMLVFLSSCWTVACTKALKDTDTTQSVSAEAQEAAHSPLDLHIDGSPSMGPHDAKVTLVVSTDFECPFCSRLAPTLEALHHRYPESVRVVFKNNPLGFHERAMPAAKAAMAAHLQGKFWPYHDRLFSNHRSLGDEELERYAEELGLDVERWRVDKESERVMAKIRHDQMSVVGLGARGTPATFINGKLIGGARPFDDFLREVDAAIIDADEEISRGTPRSYLHIALAKRQSVEGFVSSVIEGGTPLPPPKREERPPPPPEHVEIEAHPDDAFLGPVDAPLVLISFMGFQCPFCRKLTGTLKELHAAYPDTLKIVYKHLPLRFHKAGKPAAMAAIAAHAQGKFWAYADFLTENFRALGDQNLRVYAKEAKLNVKAFERFLEQEKGKAQFERDLATAKRVEVGGTPTSFLNGQRIGGAQPLSNFKELIDAELEKLKQ